MINYVKFKLKIESDEKWLDQITRNICFEYQNLNGKKTILGQIPSANGSHQKKDSLTIKINFGKNGLKGEYKIEIAGCLKTWFLGNSTNIFKKEHFNKSIDLLSQKLFIRKNRLYDAKVTSLSLGCRLKSDKTENKFQNWLFESHNQKMKIVRNQKKLKFINNNELLLIEELPSLNHCEHKTTQFVLKFKRKSKDEFLDINIRFLRDLNLRWNILLNILTLKIHQKFNHKAGIELEIFREKILKEISNTKCYLTYEEEYINYIKELPPLGLISNFVLEKSYHEIYRSKGLHEKVLQVVKTDKAIKLMSKRIEIMDRIIDELEERDETRKMADNIEWEYLEKAMYG